jgi:hypothetical protein
VRQKYDNVIAELMLHTGMRPGEACRIRLAEIDRSGEVWLYRPSRHKTAHHGHARVIAIGPKAQFVQRRFIWVQCPHCGAAGRPGSSVRTPSGCQVSRLRRQPWGIRSGLPANGTTSHSGTRTSHDAPCVYFRTYPDARAGTTPPQSQAGRRST